MNDWPPRLEHALRVAAEAHQGQTRKASGLPYITHPVAVAMLLQRHGFDNDETLAAALLHDVVEDTQMTLEELAAEFPAAVVDLVAHLTERKRDSAGNKRPWEDRKRGHIEQIATAPLAVRAIALADKLHNLSTMTYDIDAGEELSDRFNAPLDRLFVYYQSMIAAAAGEDERLTSLRDSATSALAKVRRRVSLD